MNLLPILLFSVAFGLEVPFHSENRSPSENQLFSWAVNSSYYYGGKAAPEKATNLHGAPLPSLSASQTVGPRGEILMQDFVFMEKMAAFTRERIPERVVHAKGTGAHGYFTVTHDVSHFTKAKFLNGIGKKTPVFVRFSTSQGGRDSADTVIDQKGFATKFYTEDGIHDVIGLTIEPFSVFDPMLFVDMNHSRKKNPATAQHDADAFWDFVSLRPERIHHIIHLFSDRGRPDGYRRMHGYAINVFKFVNETGGVVYGKFHWRSDQPWKYLSVQETKELAGTDPDYSTKDLYDAIEKEDFPSWTMYFQVLTQTEIDAWKGNPFDPTRVWREEDVPLIPVGKMVLNRNPVNHFAEVEQVAFAPSNLVPGVAASQDRVLNGRLFAYQDAQRYRLGGPNYPQLPINRPLNPVHTYQRDGFACHGNNMNGAPNYYPNSFGGAEPSKEGKPPVFGVSGVVKRYDLQEDDPFLQPRIYLEKDVGPEERVRLLEGMADRLKNAREEIREQVLKNTIYPISKKFGDELRAAVEKGLRSEWKKSCSWELVPKKESFEGVHGWDSNTESQTDHHDEHDHFHFTHLIKK